jgi:hypothetical protein
MCVFVLFFFLLLTVTVLEYQKNMETGATEEERQWCSEFFNENVHHYQPRPNHHHNQARRHNRQHASRNPFITLSCFTFSLEQKEFQQLYIKSADVYARLELSLLNQMLAYVAESLSEPAASSVETAANMRSSLYIEVNGDVVKQLDMDKLDEYLTSNGVEQTAATGLFEYADIKHIVEDEIFRAAAAEVEDEVAHPLALRVRLLFKNEVISELLHEEASNFGAMNMTSLNEKMVDLFADIDESVALHVRFGDRIPMPGGSQSRNKRQQNHQGRKFSQSGNRNQGKHYRDCADLRKAGFGASNYTCCRETITFSMEQIGWSHWILSPKVIEYKYCRGGCLSKYDL